MLSKLLPQTVSKVALSTSARALAIPNPTPVRESKPKYTGVSFWFSYKHNFDFSPFTTLCFRSSTTTNSTSPLVERHSPLSTHPLGKSSLKSKKETRPMLTSPSRLPPMLSVLVPHGADWMLPNVEDCWTVLLIWWKETVPTWPWVYLYLHLRF